MIELPNNLWLNKNELHKYLIEVAAQSPAKKRKVGAALVDTSNKEEGYTVLCTGYNFNPSGGPCETEDGNTHDNVIHAEVACLNNITDDLIIDNNTVMFVTHPPCDGCKAALLKVGIKYIVMGDFMKFDNGKPRMSLVPASLNLEVAKVLTYGAKKYKADNWRKVDSLERYLDALERHLAAYKSGEEVDPESGIKHISHIACNAAFLIELADLPLRKED